MFDRTLMKLDGMPPIMGALVVLAIAQAAAIIGQAFSLAGAIALLWEGAGLSAALPSTLAFAACFACLQLLRFGQECMLDRAAQRIAEGLRTRLLGETFEGGMLAARAGAAVVATTAGQGIDDVETYIRIIPPKMVGMAAISIPLLVAVFLQDWVSGVILAVMFPVIIFFMVLLGRQAAARAERQYAAYTRLSKRFVDTLRGLGTIRAFGASEHEGRAAFRYSERLREATVRTLTTATLSSAVLDLCATFGVAAVAMMLAFRLMDGSIALAPALTALILAPEYFSPIRSFASDYHASLDGKNALAAVLGLLAADDGSAGQRDGEDGAPQAEGDGGAQANLPEGVGKADDATAPEDLCWTEGSTLELRDVGFVHEDGSRALDGVSLTLRGFEKLGIVGESGAGKSTLADILAGLKAPTSGQVLLDGSPVDLTGSAWRRLVRYIPQSPYVFRASLRDNICFYSPDADDEAVMRAVSAVGLDSFVASLPQGLEALVGEGARGLSGGQAHRIALARMLLDDARVLVFDEPTAHLDIETELELKKRMLPLMEGRLVIFATHRLHWTADMDRCIAIEGGKLKELRP